MENLIPIEYKGQRVLTTSQLAESFGTEPQKIIQNFNNNKDRYKEGKHYFYLDGDELRDFKNRNIENFDIAPNINRIYFWPQKGAWMHAKSLNTDRAWEAYEALVDDYYEKLETGLPSISELSPILQFMIQSEIKQKALEHEVNALHNGLNTLTDNLTVVPDAAKVVDLINEFHRWTRKDHNEIYGMVYEILLDQHGIDVLRKVAHEREKVNTGYFAKTGRYYAEKTLKQKVTGIDVMVRMGVLDKFHAILVGLLAKVKSERKL